MIFVGLALKLENVGPSFSSFSLCLSLPSFAIDDRKQSQFRNIVLNNTTGPLLAPLNPLKSGRPVVKRSQKRKDVRTVFTRISTAAFIKFVTPQMRCLFGGGGGGGFFASWTRKQVH